MRRAAGRNHWTNVGALANCWESIWISKEWKKAVGMAYPLGGRRDMLADTVSAP